MGRRTRGLLQVCKELLLPSDNSTNPVRKAIAKKRANAKQYYDKNANGTPPPLAIGDFVYAKPAPHHKSGPWLYGIVTAIPNPRSYIVETPTGLTKRNRSHLRPAAPPPPDTLIPKAWTKHLLANSPQSTQSSTKASSPEPNQCSVNEPPSPSIQPDSATELIQKTTAEATSDNTATSVTGTGESKITTPSQKRKPPNNLQSSTCGTPVTKTRSGRISKPVKRLDL